MPARPNAHSWWQPLAVFQGLPPPAPGDRTVTLQLAWSCFCPCFPPQAWLLVIYPRATLFIQNSISEHFFTCMCAQVFSVGVRWWCREEEVCCQPVIVAGSGPASWLGLFPSSFPCLHSTAGCSPLPCPCSTPHISCPRGTYLLLSPQLGACQFGDTEMKQAGHSKQRFIGEKKMELVKLDIWDGIWLMNLVCLHKKCLKSCGHQWKAGHCRPRR